MINISDRSSRNNANCNFMFIECYSENLAIYEINLRKRGTTGKATCDSTLRYRKDAICLLDNKCKYTDTQSRHMYCLLMLTDVVK